VSIHPTQFEVLYGVFLMQPHVYFSFTAVSSYGR